MAVEFTRGEVTAGEFTLGEVMVGDFTRGEVMAGDFTRVELFLTGGEFTIDPPGISMTGECREAVLTVERREMLLAVPRGVSLSDALALTALSIAIALSVNDGLALTSPPSTPGCLEVAPAL